MQNWFKHTIAAMNTKKGQIISLLQQMHKDFEDRVLQNDKKYSLEQIWSRSFWWFFRLV